MVSDPPFALPARGLPESRADHERWMAMTSRTLSGLSGAMLQGYTSDATDDAMQANIVAAGYGK